MADSSGQSGTATDSFYNGTSKKIRVQFTVTWYRGSAESGSETKYIDIEPGETGTVEFENYDNLRWKIDSEVFE
jgi:hypothetical protein